MCVYDNGYGCVALSNVALWGEAPLCKGQTCAWFVDTKEEVVGVEVEMGASYHMGAEEYTEMARQCVDEAYWNSGAAGELDTDSEEWQQAWLDEHFPLFDVMDAELDRHMDEMAYGVTWYTGIPCDDECSASEFVPRAYKGAAGPLVRVARGTWMWFPVPCHDGACEHAATGACPGDREHVEGCNRQTVDGYDMWLRDWLRVAPICERCNYKNRDGGTWCDVCPL